MPGMIKGIVLLARKKFVVDNFGEHDLEKVLTSLPQADQDLLRGIVLPSGWYSNELNARLDSAIARVIGGPSRKAFIALGRQSAAQNLGSYQSNFVKGKDPMSFLAQTPTIYKMYFQVGRREFQSTGEKSGIITTYDAQEATEGECLTVMGWHEKALEMVGAIRPQITHPVCRARGGPYCRYDVSWT